VTDCASIAYSGDPVERPTPTHEVWARMAWAAVDMAARAGLPTERLLEGLSFDAARLRRMRRVPWDDYATICERIEELAGGGDALEKLLENEYHQVFPELRAVAGAVVSPKALTRFIADVVTPLMIPTNDSRIDDLGHDRLRIAVSLRTGARPCLSYFRGATGAIRGIPRHLDLPPAEILDADIGPEHGVWELRLPESATLVKRAGRAVNALHRVVVRLVLGSHDDGTLIGAVVGDIGPADPTERRLSDVGAAWELTPRQAEVLRYLVKGNANKEIARSLDCAENTVELHVTQLLRKARVSSRAQLIARFWSES
jgi:DNA-binding CsgD family transcriptional regulator